MLPESVAIYLELTAAGQWLDHPLRSKIQKSEAFLKIWQSPEVLKLRAEITAAEFALGDSAENTIRKLTSGGVAMAFDREHKGVVLIARTESRVWLDEYLNRLVGFAKDNAAKSGKDSPVKERNYRDAKVYQADKAIVASIEEYLIVTNKPELGRVIVDRFSDGKPRGLVDVPNFQRMSESRILKSDQADGAQEIAWTYLDLKMMRDEGIAKELLSGKAKDFAAELILGGILATLHHTPVVTGSLTLKAQVAEVQFSSPFETKWAGEEREYCFGPKGNGQALPTLNQPEMLASLSTYRDLSQLWLRAGDLFSERVNDQLAKADSTLTTLFSGRDFGEEILGAVHPELRIVVAHQEFSPDHPTPAIRLPGFAIVAQLRDPELMKGELRRAFQSLIGFANITGAMDGRPQLDLSMENNGNLQVISAEYVPEVDRKVKHDAPIHFNFSPSIAFVDQTVIVSSTIPLAKELAKKVQENGFAKTSVALGTNTHLEIDFKSLYQLLDDNRSQLISQNILKKGQTKIEAESEFQMLLSIIALIHSAQAKLDFSERASLNANLRFVE